MAEQEQNRTEQATPFKLREARRRGTVAKSLELYSLAALLTLVVVLYVFGMGMIQRQLRLDAAILGQAHLLSFDAMHILRWLDLLLAESLRTLLPLFGSLMAIAILVGLLQTRGVFTFFPLKPDIERLNPAAGLKRLFSLHMLFELGKSLLKLVLFAGAIWVIVADLAPVLMAMLGAEPATYLRSTLGHVIAVVAKLALIVALVALLDIAFTRWSYMDRLKMSRREVKDEHKRLEGDPRVRARQRELQRELVKRARSIKRVPEADVLITNPTRIAVALRYRKEEMAAPQLIAKGMGELAEHMRALARRHRVPIVENRALARRLFAATALEHEIPQALYPAVARLLVWAYSLRGARV